MSVLWRFSEPPVSVMAITDQPLMTDRPRPSWWTHPGQQGKPSRATNLGPMARPRWIMIRYSLCSPVSIAINVRRVYCPTTRRRSVVWVVNRLFRHCDERDTETFSDISRQRRGNMGDLVVPKRQPHLHHDLDSRQHTSSIVRPKGLALGLCLIRPRLRWSRRFQDQDNEQSCDWRKNLNNET